MCLCQKASNICIRIGKRYASYLIILGEIDCISVSNPSITVHECKYKVDGVTKYVDNLEFIFDNAFSDEEHNEDLYLYSIKPLIDLVFNSGIVTVFAYG